MEIIRFFSKSEEDDTQLLSSSVFSVNLA